jgi:hypothetical protein
MPQGRIYNMNDFSLFLNKSRHYYTDSKKIFINTLH